jgi:hypothetical protein
MIRLKFFIQLQFSRRKTGARHMDAQWKQRSSVTRSVDLMDWIFFI